MKPLTPDEAAIDFFTAHPRYRTKVRLAKIMRAVAVEAAKSERERLREAVEGVKARANDLSKRAKESKHQHTYAYQLNRANAYGEVLTIIDRKPTKGEG